MKSVLIALLTMFFSVAQIWAHDGHGGGALAAKVVEARGLGNAVDVVLDAYAQEHPVQVLGIASESGALADPFDAVDIPAQGRVQIAVRFVFSGAMPEVFTVYLQTAGGFFGPYLAVVK